MSRTSEKYGLVLCEGKEDCVVLQKIAEATGLDGLQFEPFGGKDKLPARLEQLSLSPEFTRGQIHKILITRDADGSWEAAFQSLKDAVQRIFGLELSQTGEWAALNGHCKIALWIIPGDDQTGMLETLCLQAAKDVSPSDFECLDQFATCLNQQSGAVLHAKEKFAIWSVVAQDKQLPRQRLSLLRAIERIPIDWTHSSFARLSDLLAEVSSGKKV